MIAENQGNISGFIIQGISDAPLLQLSFFTLILCIYIFILMGNIFIFLTISLNFHLHIPMYIFLLNLSIIDIIFTTNILPNLLYILSTGEKTILFWGCMVQMYMFLSLTCSEYYLLTAMAYDRYIAICKPLYYVTHMSQKHCAYFIGIVWTAGFLEPIAHIVLISNLSYCASHVVDFFFCDLTPLLKLSCSDTIHIENLTYIVGACLPFNCFLLTFISYIFIIAAILKIQSSDGRQKAFSTCSAHLTSTVIFYTTIMCLYMRPSASYTPGKDKFFALLLIILIPMLNPIIYTLKNREFQLSFKKLLIKISAELK